MGTKFIIQVFHPHTNGQLAFTTEFDVLAQGHAEEFYRAMCKTFPDFQVLLFKQETRTYVENIAGNEHQVTDELSWRSEQHNKAAKVLQQGHRRIATKQKEKK